MTALAALAAVSCLSERTDGPTSAAVALRLHATVRGLEGTRSRDPSVRIHVAYQRDTGAFIQLPSQPQSVSIGPGVTTQPVLVDIAPCLADAQHTPLGGRECNLSVALVLLVDGAVADSENQTANQMASPGSTLNMTTVTLTAPTAVVVDRHTAQLVAGGAPLSLSAAVYDSSLLLVGHPVTWTSSAPAVASVAPVGPDSVIVTPLTAGSTVIKASSGSVSDSALITVAATTGAVQIGLSRASVTATYALSLGTNPSPAVITVTDSGTAPLSGLALSSVVYAPANGPKGWLSAALGATTAPTNITISLTPNKLAAPPPVGTYTASFQVSSPLASNSPRTIVVTLVVTPGPSAVIDLSQAAVTDTFALSLGTNPSPSTIRVTDGGALPLSQLSLGAVAYRGNVRGWLTASLSSTTAPASITVSLTPSKLPAPPPVGTYTASFTIASPVASNSPQTVVVTLVVTHGPSAVINLSQAAVTDTFARSTGTNPSPSAIRVTDGGALPLTGLSLSAVTYQGPAEGWLSASLGATTAPTTITLSVNAVRGPGVAPIPVGTYTGTFTVNSSVASNSPRTVVVTLVVTTGPQARINLSATGASEQLTLVGNDPPGKGIAVSDGGPLPLSGLTAGTPTYSPARPGGWLNVSVGPTAPTKLTMTPRPVETGQTFAAGTYTATFQLSAPQTSNSPRTIVDTMIVTPGVIGLSATALTDSVINGAIQPWSQQSITVTDSGGAPLTGLAVSAPAYGTPFGPAWLSSQLVPPSFVGAPTTILLAVNQSVTQLDNGTYTATVTVTAPGIAPRTITVTMIVEFIIFEKRP